MRWKTTVLEHEEYVMTIEQFHKEIDRLVAPVKSCCARGCFACCYEPVYASRAEAQHIVDGLTEARKILVKERLVDWLADADLTSKTITSLRWRRLLIPCPLLKDNECSVYERRPIGCRMFFAVSNPENCSGPARRHQLFVSYPKDITIAIAGTAWQIEPNIVMDHLGVHLANILLGMNLESSMCCKHQAE